MSESREMLEQREKAKLDEAEKNLVHIPIEMWKQIFKYSAARDLLNLSLVCKRFYETIGSLPEAMDKITLNLYNSKLTDNELIIKSSRSYKNIKFHSIRDSSDAKICLEVIEKFGDGLRDLELSSCTFTGGEFYKIIEYSKKTLKALSIQGSLLKGHPGSLSAIIAPGSLILSKLQKLEIRSPGPGLVDIKNVFNLVPDTLQEVSGVFWDDELLLRFLETHENLKHLSLVPLQSTEFLEKISCATINFKLEKLDIGILHQMKICKIFDEFLKSQAESLRDLRLVNIPVNDYDSFKNMPNLQSLEIVKIGQTYEEYKSGPNFDCPSLKTLIIDYGSNAKKFSFLNFFKRFPTAQEIVLKITTDYSMMQVISKNHPNLKTLVIEEFDDNSFKHVKFKNLKKLEVFNVDETPEIDMKHSILAMENLEVLKLGSYVLVTEKSLLQILNFKKLKRLEIANGSRLNDDLLSKHSDLLKNLRFLIISNLGNSVEKMKSQEKELCSKFKTL